VSNGGRGELVVERKTTASPSQVFSYFSNGDRWRSWQGVEAEIDLRVDGAFRVNVTGDGYASGRFIEVVPDRKVVFTWGWERADSPVPPGSSRVTIELEPLEDGTLIRLTHSDLPPEEVDVHRYGWENYSTRLTHVAMGRDPGPDPMRAVT
jgi:uncharacterized protein YndB with AHSA1/START domain